MNSKKRRLCCTKLGAPAYRLLPPVTISPHMIMTQADPAIFFIGVIIFLVTMSDIVHGNFVLLPQFPTLPIASPDELPTQSMPLQVRF